MPCLSRRLFFLVTAWVAAWISAAPGPALASGGRVALVIGNSAYQHSPPLANPRNDASDVAAVLTGLGFKVVKGLDLKKADMDRTIRDFAEALATASTGLFFYAGHGLQVSGENYLVPVDAKLVTASALDFEMVPLATVQRVMERAAATNIIFLDACRDNPLARNLARAMGTRSAAIGRGMAAMQSGVGTLISFSTQPGNVALDGAGRNSPFAAALVDRMTVSRDDLSTLLIEVRNKVMSSTGNRQVPWEHSALTARFYLQGASRGEAGPSAPSPSSDAALAWSATKDSSSVAVLRAFITKYESTIFAELAKARLAELEAGPAEAADDGEVKTAENSAAAAATGGPEAKFDGKWLVTVRQGKGSKCKMGNFEFPISIRQSQISGGPLMKGGSVKPDGAIAFSHRSKSFAHLDVEYTGSLEGERGEAKMMVTGGKCFGAAVLTRLR